MSLLELVRYFATTTDYYGSEIQQHPFETRRSVLEKKHHFRAHNIHEAFLEETKLVHFSAPLSENNRIRSIREIKQFFRIQGKYLLKAIHEALLKAMCDKEFPSPEEVIQFYEHHHLKSVRGTHTSTIQSMIRSKVFGNALEHTFAPTEQKTLFHRHILSLLQKPLPIDEVVFGFFEACDFEQRLPPQDNITLYDVFHAFEGVYRDILDMQNIQGFVQKSKLSYLDTNEVSLSIKPSAHITNKLRESQQHTKKAITPGTSVSPSTHTTIRLPLTPQLEALKGQKEWFFKVQWDNSNKESPIVTPIAHPFLSIEQYFLNQEDLG